MVRPLRPEDEDESSVMFQGPRTSGGGIMGGSGGGNMQNIASQGGRFAASDGLGTGFVNADQYLKANQGKGAALGERLTEGAKNTASRFGGELDILNSYDTTWEATPYQEDHDWKGKGFNKASDYYDSRAKWWEENPDTYKGPSKSELEARRQALLNLTQDANKISGILDPKDRSGRELRAGVLSNFAKTYNQDPSNSKKISYNPTSQGFDAMFVESEAPNLISQRYQSLQDMLKRSSGFGEDIDRKIGEVDQSMASSDQWNRDRVKNYRRWGDEALIAEKEAEERAKRPQGQPQDPNKPDSGNQNPPPAVEVIRPEQPTWGPRGISGASSDRDQPTNGPRGINTGRPNTGRGSREIPPRVKVDAPAPASAPGPTRPGGTSVEQSRKNRQTARR